MQNRKRFKWWVKNNYIYLIIVGVVCLVMALIIIHEVYNYNLITNMEALLQKSRREMHWESGITDQDVEVLKKRYPNINWEENLERQRWLSGQKSIKEARSRDMARQKLRQRK